METAQIKEEFKQILSEVMKDGVSPDEAHNTARIILQEAGKDRRTAMMNHAKQHGNGTANGNGTAPASDKQKELLKKFNVSFADSLTRNEASKLIEEAIAKKNGK